MKICNANKEHKETALNKKLDCTKCRQSLRRPGPYFNYEYKGNRFCRNCSKDVRDMVDARIWKNKAELTYDKVIENKYNKIRELVDRKNKLESDIKQKEQEFNVWIDRKSPVRFLFNRIKKILLRTSELF